MLGSQRLWPRANNFSACSLASSRQRFWELAKKRRAPDQSLLSSLLWAIMAGMVSVDGSRLLAVDADPMPPELTDAVPSQVSDGLSTLPYSGTSTPQG